MSSDGASMDISVNGSVREIDSGSTVDQLIVGLGLNPAGVAVAVNKSVVPRSSRSNHMLKPDDRVEIIQAVGGG